MGWPMLWYTLTGLPSEVRTFDSRGVQRKYALRQVWRLNIARSADPPLVMTNRAAPFRYVAFRGCPVRR